MRTPILYQYEINNYFGGYYLHAGHPESRYLDKHYANGGQDAYRQLKQALRGRHNYYFTESFSIGVQSVIHHEAYGRIYIDFLQGTMLVLVEDKAERKAFEKALFLAGIEYDIVGDNKYYRINKYK